MLKHSFKHSSKFSLLRLPHLSCPLNWLVALLLLSVLAATGCGSGSMQIVNPPPPPQAPQITSQPASLSVPLGQTATFSVTATGTTPLTYQWSENGMPIANATASTYTTASVAPVDSGSKFTVTVTNSVGSVSSNAASLTVGPRSPKAGDLRFQQVDAASTINGYGAALHTNIFAGLSENFTNTIGSPLTIGGTCGSTTNPTPLNCSWEFTTFPLPTGVSGINMTYATTNSYANLASDINSLSYPNAVITSLDLEPTFDTYAIASMQVASHGTFDLSQQTASPASFPVAAAQAGAQSRVITAVSFDATGQVYFISYGWQGDTTTVYETMVVNTTFDNIGTEATTLAADGYIITALGGNYTDGFILVGTRVQGDTIARPFLVVPQDQQFPQAMQQGYAFVGYLVSSDATNIFWLAEK